MNGPLNKISRVPFFLATLQSNSRKNLHIPVEFRDRIEADWILPFPVNLSCKFGKSRRGPLGLSKKILSRWRIRGLKLFLASSGVRFSQSEWNLFRKRVLRKFRISLIRRKSAHCEEIFCSFSNLMHEDRKFASPYIIYIRGNFEII